MRSEMRSKKTVREGFTIRQSEGPVTLVVYEPGNGTSYKMIVTRIGAAYDQTSEIDARAFAHFGIKRGVYFVNLVYFNRSFFVDPQDIIHYIFVREKLECSVLDAVVIAEAVGTLLQLPHVSVDEYLQMKTG